MPSITQLFAVSFVALATFASPLSIRDLNQSSSNTNDTFTLGPVPSDCAPACNAMQDSFNTCQVSNSSDLRPTILNPETLGFKSNLTTLESTCVCNDTISSYFANCFSCNGYSGYPFDALAFETYNGNCLSQVQAGHLNGTWTNATRNNTGGLHGPGSSIVGSKFFFSSATKSQVGAGALVGIIALMSLFV